MSRKSKKTFSLGTTDYPDEADADGGAMRKKSKPAFNSDVLAEAQDCADVNYDHTTCTGCEDYCRCTSVINVRLVSLYVGSFVESVIPEELRHTISGYCAERLLRYTGACDKDNWSVQIHDGYYGQEIGGVKLNAGVAEATTDHLRRLVRFRSDAARMEHILKLEYGYLLPSLRKREWTIRQVRREDVIIGQENHYYRKLDGRLVASYREHPFPVAVCAVIDLAYRLIDGYHRFASTEGDEEVTVVLAT